MNTNSEILEIFGKIVINECFDPAFMNMISLRKKEDPPLIFKNYVDFFKSLDEDEFKVLVNYHKESLGAILFNFLRVFEEHSEYKIYFESEGNRIDLVEISENLKSEPIIINGWIERFSKARL
jgi:hypothetical protein